MLKVMAFLTKKEGMETQAFIEYYENNHVPLILSLAPAPIIYKRNYLVRGDEFKADGVIGFNVVTELVFFDRATYLAWGARMGEQVIADELKFLDRSRTRAYVVEEHMTSE
jgi:hypothetical protein